MRKHNLGPMIVVVAAVLQPLAGADAAVRYVAFDGSGADGQSWATAYRTVQAALDDAAVGAGDEIWVKQGTYQRTQFTGYISVNKIVHIYGGFAGTEIERDQRDWRTNVTTVRGVIGSTNFVRCFRITANATLDGFTVTNGDAGSADGGGADCGVHRVGSQHRCHR